MKYLLKLGWLFGDCMTVCSWELCQINTGSTHCDILDGFLRSLVKLLRRTWPVFLTWILARRASFCHWRGSKMMVIMDDSESSSPLCTRVSGASKRQGTWRYCTWVAIEMSIFHLFSWRFEDHKAGLKTQAWKCVPRGSRRKNYRQGGVWWKLVTKGEWWKLMIFDDSWWLGGGF